MIFTRNKLLPATVRNSVVPPSAIIDNFVEDMKVQRDFHYAEAERLRSVIEDATARLGNHKTALEACENVLETVRVDQALTISHLDIEPERTMFNFKVENPATAAALHRHEQDVA